MSNNNPQIDDSKTRMKDVLKALGSFFGFAENKEAKINREYIEKELNETRKVEKESGATQRIEKLEERVKYHEVTPRKRKNEKKVASQYPEIEPVENLKDKNKEKDLGR